MDTDKLFLMQDRWSIWTNIKLSHMHSEYAYGTTRKRTSDFEKKKIMPHNLPAQLRGSHVHEYDQQSVGVNINVSKTLQ